MRKMLFNIARFCLPVIFLSSFLMLPGFAKDPAAVKNKASSLPVSSRNSIKAPAGNQDHPSQKPAVASFAVQEAKDATAFFEKAAKLALTNPVSAIALYQRGIILKPDAWKERKELAALYEKQGQWNMALAEYEAISRADKSAGSFINLVRMLDKSGYLHSAAAEAKKAFAQYPARPEFLLQAGELFHRAGDEAAAVTSLQEYLKLKPGNGQALMVLGAVYEKTKKPADALTSYLRAEKQGNKEAADAVKRLRAGNAVIGGLTIFLPQGWAADKDGMTNLQSGERVTVAVKSTGSPAALALTSAREAMPREPFSEENIKQKEQFKIMQQELAKKNPESAKNMPSGMTPISTQGDFPPLKGAKKAVLSTGETLRPGMESAVAVAVPVGGKIYIFLWRAARPAADGEKTLSLLLGQSVWPL